MKASPCWNRYDKDTERDRRNRRGRQAEDTDTAAAGMPCTPTRRQRRSEIKTVQAKDRPKRQRLYEGNQISDCSKMLRFRQDWTKMIVIPSVGYTASRCLKLSMSSWAQQKHQSSRHGAEDCQIEKHCKQWKTKISSTGVDDIWTTKLSKTKSTLQLLSGSFREMQR